ncbi:VOC family protein [Streptomyces sp. NPDC055092]
MRLPEEALTGGADRISDPHGGERALWLHAVPDAKAVKNRLHIDIHASGDRTDPIETRKERVDAEADRLMGLGAIINVVMCEKGIDHYAVGMKDPEGNEFDINGPELGDKQRALPSRNGQVTKSRRCQLSFFGSRTGPC